MNDHNDYKELLKRAPYIKFIGGLPNYGSQDNYTEADAADAARETLETINEMAAQMMAGREFVRPQPSKNYPWSARASLARSGYHENPEYKSIEIDLASGQTFVLAVQRLRAIMLQSCREEAAWFLLALTSSELRDMELLVDEYFGGGK
jgi:hypothetical protein